MPKVRAGSAKKWRTNASRSTAAYEDGIKNPRRDWEDATAGAEDNYELGIQKAIADGRFGKGVRRAGDEKWKKNALEKGPQRYAQGVGLAENEYASGIAPYLQVIESTTLPPRFPKGDPRNLDRVRVMTEALRAAKESR